MTDEIYCIILQLKYDTYFCLWIQLIRWTDQTQNDSRHIDTEHNRSFDEGNQSHLQQSTHYFSIRYNQERQTEVNSQSLFKKNRDKAVFNDTSDIANSLLIEVKYMCTNASASNIEKILKSFKKVIQNSRLWKKKRSQELKMTKCLATLFSKNNTQNVSLMIWCDHDKEYHLISIYKMKLAWSF